MIKAKIIRKLLAIFLASTIIISTPGLVSAVPNKKEKSTKKFFLVEKQGESDSESEKDGEQKNKSESGSEKDDSQENKSESEDEKDAPQEKEDDFQEGDSDEEMMDVGQLETRLKELKDKLNEMKNQGLEKKEKKHICNLCQIV